MLNQTCPVCGSSELKFWAREYQGYEIVQCQDCHLRFMREFRTVDENAEVYGEHYFISRQKTAQGRLEEEFLYLVREFSSLRRLQNYIELTPESKILDIGTGAGKFLKLLRYLGYKNIKGMDITAANQETLKEFGIELQIGFLQDLPADEKFDLITLFHVLEHVEQPREFVRALFARLNPGGISYMVLPNEGGWSSKIKSFQSRWLLKPKPYKHLAPQHHVIYYHAAAVRRLFEDAGFEVLYCKGSRASEKHRNVIARFDQWLRNAFGGNSWLEVVVRRPKA